MDFTCKKFHIYNTLTHIFFFFIKRNIFRNGLLYSNWIRFWNEKCVSNGAVDAGLRTLSHAVSINLPQSEFLLFFWERKISTHLIRNEFDWFNLETVIWFSLFLSFLDIEMKSSSFFKWNLRDEEWRSKIASPTTESSNWKNSSNGMKRTFSRTENIPRSYCKHIRC